MTPQPSYEPIRGNFVLLRAGNLRLLLPQSDVGAAEYLDRRPQPCGEPGVLMVEGDDSGRFYAALSERMTLLAECPEDRFVVAMIGNDANTDGGGIGWCWDELQVLIDIEVRPLPLPEVLLPPGAPVRHYAELGGEIPVFVCDARHLTGFALATMGT